MTNSTVIRMNPVDLLERLERIIEECESVFVTSYIKYSYWWKYVGTPYSVLKEFMGVTYGVVIKSFESPSEAEAIYKDRYDRDTTIWRNTSHYGIFLKHVKSHESKIARLHALKTALSIPSQNNASVYLGSEDIDLLFELEKIITLARRPNWSTP